MLHENRESSHEIIEIRNVIVVAKKTFQRMYQGGNTQRFSTHINPIAAHY